MDITCANPYIRAVHRYKSLPNGKVGIIDTDYFICSCGKCVPCLLREQREWALRLQLEAEVTESAWFITLTYNDDFLPADRQLVPKEIDLFMDAIRHRVAYVCDKKQIVKPHLSYFAVGEYGRKENRPHYHLMLFGFPIHDMREMYTLIVDIWKKGFVKVEPCDISTCNYICKYMMKLDPRSHDVPSFRKMSRRPAIGFRYFQQHPAVVEFLNQPGNNGIRLRDGRFHSIPRSIRRKFLSSEKLCLSRDKVKISGETFNSKKFRDDMVKLKSDNHLTGVLMYKRITQRFVS